MRRLATSPGLDAETRRLLQHVKLVTLANEFYEESVAVSDFIGTIPTVTVNDSLIINMLGVAKFIAAIQSSDDDDQIVKEIVVGHQWHTNPSQPFSFSTMSRLSEERLPEILVNDIFTSAISWLVFHEVGHLRLGHKQLNSKPASERKEVEIAADAWAFERVNVAGLSLPALESFFAGQQLIESLRYQSAPREHIDHPSWRERRYAAYRFMSEYPPKGTGLVFLVAVEGVTKDGAPSITWISMPADPSNGGVRAALQMNGETVHGALEIDSRKPKESILYFSKAGRRLKITVSNRFAHVARVRITTTGKGQNAKVLDMHRLGIAWFAESVDDARAQSSMWDTSVEKLLAQPLVKLGLSPEAEAKARAEVRAYATLADRAALGQAKGELTDKAYRDLAGKNAERLKANLKAILGERWSAYQSVLYADPVLRAIGGEEGPVRK